MSASVTRGELEDFLFLEAALLDNWQLDEWLALRRPALGAVLKTAGRQARRT